MCLPSWTHRFSRSAKRAKLWGGGRSSPESRQLKHTASPKDQPPPSNKLSPPPPTSTHLHPPPQLRRKQAAPHRHPTERPRHNIPVSLHLPGIASLFRQASTWDAGTGKLRNKSIGKILPAFRHASTLRNHSRWLPCCRRPRRRQRLRFPAALRASTRIKRQVMA